MTRLPSFNALRAFEAAARLESFNKAAEELHVTASAVSHQVRALEGFLGVRLFHRGTRKVTPSPEGRLYLSSVQSALAQLRAATEQMRREDAVGPLTISAAPSFAVGWLMLRLSDFQVRHPGIEVRLNAAVEVMDLSRSDVDVGIRTGEGDWPGLVSHALMTEELIPVCSPALLQGRNGLKRPEDLERMSLLHVLPRIGQWRSWLCAAGVCDGEPERGPKFQTPALAVDAAMAGLGVAIANRRFVEHHLKDGRLVTPFEMGLPTECTYYLVYLEERVAHPRVAAFREWVFDALREEEGSDVTPPPLGPTSTSSPQENLSVNAPAPAKRKAPGWPE